MSTVVQGKPRWQDAVALLLGAWLFAAPFVVDYGPLSEPAAWNSYLAGIAVVIASAWALRAPEDWEEWVNIVLGAWLVIAPFVLGFYPGLAAAAWNEVIVGLLIGGDAMRAISARPSGGAPLHQH